MPWIDSKTRKDLDRLVEAYGGGAVRRVPPKARALVLRYLEVSGVNTPVEARVLGDRDAVEANLSPAKPWAVSRLTEGRRLPPWRRDG